ncbi:hypothetical protein HU200_043420 [Digitaria exilis]|uniref:Uncharacterized protein n=1 Tax=Digitaria exilis TaxID=1010633 RepID=A0A835EF27_9POAL|nr:hypothetical protein HU200_043420 [Digitaria exilis]
MTRRLDGDPERRGNFPYHLDSDLWNGSVMRSLRRAWRGPSLWCFPMATSEVESNGGRGEAPARCVLVVATARQPGCGPDPVVSSCQVVRGVAAALRRRVPHSGGFLFAVQSAYVGYLSTRGHCLTRFCSSLLSKINYMVATWFSRVYVLFGQQGEKEKKLIRMRLSFTHAYTCMEG